MEFNYGTSVICYNILRSDRKTVSISILPSKEIVVKAPEKLSDYEVDLVVKTKAKWITETLFDMSEIESVKRLKEYVNGETFLYLGRNYMLDIIQDEFEKKAKVKLIRGKLTVRTSSKEEEILKKAVEEWYKKRARVRIPERVEYYSKYIREPIGEIKIKEQKKRWGSCNKNGDLAFNWRAVMAPANILDYIIVHELCHLKYMNHSKDFWNHVAQILPDYEKRKKWLMDNGINLDL